MIALSSRSLRLLRRGGIRRNGPLAWWGLYRQRQQLGALDDRLLDDIGRSRTEAEAEATRPLWDAPNHWRK